MARPPPWPGPPYPAPRRPVAGAPASGGPAPRAPARHARGLTVVAAAGIGIAIAIMMAASLVRGAWMLPPVPMAAADRPGSCPSGMCRRTWSPAGCGWPRCWAPAAGGRPARHPPRRPDERPGPARGRPDHRGGADRPAPRRFHRRAGLRRLRPAAGPGPQPVRDHPRAAAPRARRVAHSIPHVWQHVVSVYGPLATMEQFVAARLGGASAARITFWLKLWDRPRSRWSPWSWTGCCAAAS